MDISFIRRLLFYTGIFAIFGGLMFSRGLLSTGMIILLANALFTGNLKSNFKTFIENKVLLSITLVFFVYLLTGLYSENTDYFLQRMRVKLPLLALPFAIGTQQYFRKKDFYIILSVFIGVIAVSSFWVLANYAANFSEITQSLRHGKSIPVPYDHIRYSLMVAFCTIACIYLSWINPFQYIKWMRIAILFVAVYLFVFMHVLSVRSGLLAMYVSLFYISIWILVHLKKKAIGILAIVAIFSIPVIAYLAIPSFHKKINYMVEDVTKYLDEGKTNEYSDAKRIVSIKMGIRVGNESPLIGVGVGDVRDEMNQKYDEFFPDAKNSDKLIPHNQYVFVYAATGILGLSICLYAFLLPLFYKKYSQNWLFVCLNLIILFSFLVESTIEIQIGTAFYVIFLTLGVRYLESKETTTL